MTQVTTVVPLVDNNKVLQDLKPFRKLNKVDSSFEFTLRCQNKSIIFTKLLISDLALTSNKITKEQLLSLLQDIQNNTYKVKSKRALQEIIDKTKNGYYDK